MTTTSTKLAERRCVPCEGGTKPLSTEECIEMKQKLGAQWQLATNATQLIATFEFKNYFRTLAFVNAVAYIAIQEDHHPDLSFSYKTCTVMFWTHNINGLSENDFICAAKVDALLG